MKPSTRISEIANSTKMDFAIRGQLQGYVQAILEYLDEQYDKDCSRSGHDFKKDESTGYYFCSKCNACTGSP